MYPPSAISLISIDAYRAAIREALGLASISDDKIEIIRTIILPRVNPNEITVNTCSTQAHFKWEECGKTIKKLNADIDRLSDCKHQKAETKAQLMNQIQGDGDARQNEVDAINTEIQSLESLELQILDKQILNLTRQKDNMDQLKERIASIREILRKHPAMNRDQ